MASDKTIPDWAYKALGAFLFLATSMLGIGLAFIIQISNQISRNDERLKNIEVHNQEFKAIYLDHERRIYWLESQHNKYSTDQLRREN